PNKITILLVNTHNKISKYPIDYFPVISFENSTIWRPIGSNGYKPIGYIVSKNKPSLENIRVINNDLVTLYRGESKVVSNNTNMNEFNLLSIDGDTKYTIKRTPMLDRNSNIKLLSKKS